MSNTFSIKCLNCQTTRTTVRGEVCSLTAYLLFDGVSPGEQRSPRSPGSVRADRRAGRDGVCRTEGSERNHRAGGKTSTDGLKDLLCCWWMWAKCIYFPRVLRGEWANKEIQAYQVTRWEQWWNNAGCYESEGPEAKPYKSLQSGFNS